MKQPIRWSVALGAGLVLSLGALAPVANASGAEGSTPAGAGAPAAASDVASKLPAGWQTRRDALAAQLGLEPSPAAEALRRVINPGDYDCGPTDIDSYVGQLIADMSDADIDFLINTPALDIPTYDALIFGSDTDPRYALADHATQLKNTFRDVKKFWDIESGDIQLHAMHGDMLQDTARVSRMLELFGLNQTDAAALAEYMADFVAASPALDGGDNPLFTFNAFAFTGEGEPDPFFASLPDKLIFGDGILDFLDAIGIGNVGPRAVMGHEFGHHIQFEDDLFESPLTGAELTRRMELMADAFATYFAVHARGLALNAKRVLDAEMTFYQVGDCEFADPNHHGTPNQRLRASTWAADLASAARPQGRILPSLTFAELFEAKLPELVAPDAA